MVVSTRKIRTDGVNGQLYQGLGEGPHPGVLVLHGAGGARGYEQQYAKQLAEHGYTALCVEYFGAPGIRDALVEIPLEEFGNAAEWLLSRSDIRGDHVGVVGFSRGGEASLLAGSQFDTVGVVIAYVPSCYVWPAPSWMEGVGEDEPTWTLDGEPLPHLRIDEYIDETDDIGDPLGSDGQNPPRLAVERATPRERGQATIPVEDIDGPILFVTGGQDVLWPASLLADRACERLDAHDHPWSFEHLSFPDAGHAIRVPYRFEVDTDPEETHRYGGTHAANARASARAWQTAIQYLDSALSKTDASL